ncbi:diguanylate cyclase domain-containing protein [Elusimicrobiota bacterium]
MPTKTLSQGLDELTCLALEISRGEKARVDDLMALGASPEVPKKINELAEIFANMLVQVEGREFRLECIIEDLEIVQQELEKSNYDPLTGLPNRVIFHARLEQALRRALRDKAPMAIMFLDLDRFKAVNDTLGHDAGDALLRLAAGRLKGALREGDLAARLGGDEFTVICSGGVTERELSVLGQRLVDRLGEPFEVPGGTANIGTSIGIAMAPAHTENSEELLKKADVAMYRAKALGRDNFQIWTP